MTSKNLSVKPIPGYQGYFVSSTGTVLSFRHRNGYRKDPLIMRQFVKRDGYLQTQLTRDDGARRSENVHRLVAMAFIPNPENKPTVNHKNGIKTDNTPGNLEWASRKEQSQHALKVLRIDPSRWTRGNKFAASLTSDQVDTIRIMLSEGFSGRNIASMFKVSAATISLIKNRRTWNG
jgi:hypothetical protein